MLRGKRLITTTHKYTYSIAIAIYCTNERRRESTMMVMVTSMTIIKSSDIYEAAMERPREAKQLIFPIAILSVAGIYKLSCDSYGDLHYCRALRILLKISRNLLCGSYYKYR